MSELDGERGWTDGDAAWSNPVERNLDRLKDSAIAGLGLAILLLVAAAAQFSHAAGTVDGSPVAAVVTLVLAIGSLAWGGLAALAYWTCGALLAGRTPQD